MTTTRARGLVAAAGLAVGAVGAGACAPSAPRAAEPTTFAAEPYGIAVSGNFVGDAREELFSYASGAGADYLVSFGNGGAPGGELQVEDHLFRVSGEYFPVAGDFDGDGYDEILFYAPGPAADHMWDFVDADTATSRPEIVNGDFWPTAGDFTGDGADDIIFHAPGAATDFLWENDPGGGRASTTLRVGGTYEPVSGSFGTDGTDDVFWYAEGTEPDSLWDFRAGTTGFASRPQEVNGVYWPVGLDVFAHGAGGGDILWYAAGATADPLWDWVGGERRTPPISVSVSGDYAPVAGDYFADGHDDVLWLAEGGFHLWDFAPDGAGGVVRHDYREFATVLGAQTPRSAPPRVAALAGRD
jgi:hypothetical protein